MRLLIRLLGLLFVIYAALSLVRGLLGVIAPKQSIRSGSSGRLVKDPVCGTYIPEDTVFRAGDHFFCSQECQRKFLNG